MIIYLICQISNVFKLILKQKFLASVERLVIYICALGDKFLTPNLKSVK